MKTLGCPRPLSGAFFVDSTSLFIQYDTAQAGLPKIHTNHPLRIVYLRTKVFCRTNTLFSEQVKREDGRLQLGPREERDVSSRGRGRVVGLSSGKQYDEH